ncbi:MAG: hypothetical protein IPG34_15720 [Rhodocyclaceae bacterium]|nr:hypothetical protein [Rhodocyclaceae bacterium]
METPLANGISQHEIHRMTGIDPCKTIRKIGRGDSGAAATPPMATGSGRRVRQIPTPATGSGSGRKFGDTLRLRSPIVNGSKPRFGFGRNAMAIYQTWSINTASPAANSVKRLPESAARPSRRSLTAWNFPGEEAQV